MEICRTIIEVRKSVQNARKNGKSIGLVPTMGALHSGHLTLIDSSNVNCDFTIATIFVNPAQFNNPEDLANYPKTLDEDVKKLIEAGCDLLFLPTAGEIYPSKTAITIRIENIGETLEGEFRPGHFDGVTLVISKLFNIIQPDQAFFGQKDIQQYCIIKALADQLNFPVKVVKVQTAREANGLAMSSRNMRLSVEQRNQAALIFKALTKAQKNLLSGESAETVMSEIDELFSTSDELALEYFEIINTDDFKPTTEIADQRKIALCIAVQIGPVRLIDNLMLIS